MSQRQQMATPVVVKRETSAPGSSPLVSSFMIPSSEFKIAEDLAAARRQEFFQRAISASSLKTKVTKRERAGDNNSDNNGESHDGEDDRVTNDVPLPPRKKIAISTSLSHPMSKRSNEDSPSNLAAQNREIKAPVASNEENKDGAHQAKLEKAGKPQNRRSLREILALKGRSSVLGKQAKRLTNVARLPVHTKDTNMASSDSHDLYAPLSPAREKTNAVTPIYTGKCVMAITPSDKATKMVRTPYVFWHGLSFSADNECS